MFLLMNSLENTEIPIKYEVKKLKFILVFLQRKLAKLPKKHIVI